MTKNNMECEQLTIISFFAEDSDDAKVLAECAAESSEGELPSGVESDILSDAEQLEVGEKAKPCARSVETNTAEIDISLVFANPNQPRKLFDEDALKELSASIAKHGIVMPIVVNRSGDRYMIIAGERRFRAAKLAGLKTVPVVIKNYNEREVKEIALIENLQREDLNAIEAAMAMRRLMDDYGLTQEDLAERLGKNRSTVANTLRLLTLTPEVIKLVANGKLSAGHARALLTLPANIQYAIALQSVSSGDSVRDVERRVRDYFNPPEKEIKEVKRSKNTVQSLELQDFINRMQRGLGTKVSAIGNDNKGRIYIDYYSRDDLDRLAEMLELIEKKNGLNQF